MKAAHSYGDGINYDLMKLEELLALNIEDTLKLDIYLVPTIQARHCNSPTATDEP
jgi:hypothetical protein